MQCHACSGDMWELLDLGQDDLSPEVLALLCEPCLPPPAKKRKGQRDDEDGDEEDDDDNEEDDQPMGDEDREENAGLDGSSGAAEVPKPCAKAKAKARGRPRGSGAAKPKAKAKATAAAKTKAASKPKAKRQVSQEEKDLLKRKSNAYKKARAAAEKEGKDEESAKAAGREACIIYLAFMSCMHVIWGLVSCENPKMWGHMQSAPSVEKAGSDILTLNPRNHAMHTCMLDSACNFRWIWLHA